MASFKITDLTELASGSVADTDVLEIVDLDADASKKVTIASLKTVFDGGGVSEGDSYTGGTSNGIMFNSGNTFATSNLTFDGQTLVHTLTNGQSNAALQINSYGNTGGDLYKVNSDGDFEYSDGTRTISYTHSAVSKMSVHGASLFQIGAGTSASTLTTYTSYTQGGVIDLFSNSNWRARFGSSLASGLSIGGLSPFSATSQIHVRGYSTTTGSAFKVEDSSMNKNFEVIDNGTVRMPRLPTSSSGLSAGDLWNDSGTLKIA